jgi:hypothetical protein
MGPLTPQKHCSEKNSPISVASDGANTVRGRHDVVVIQDGGSTVVLPFSEKNNRTYEKLNLGVPGITAKAIDYCNFFSRIIK